MEDAVEVVKEAGKILEFPGVTAPAVVKKAAAVAGWQIAAVASILAYSLTFEGHKPHLDLDEDVKRPDPDTIIYRTGSGSHYNLTPRETDMDGLSYTTVLPEGENYTMTTVKAVESTGYLYAYFDANPAKPNHVLINCTLPFKYAEWQATKKTADTDPHIYSIFLREISVRMNKNHQERD